MTLLEYPFMVRALLAALFTGLAAPAVGTYLVQRRLALMGDGIGHIAERNQQCGDAAKEQGRAGPVDPRRCRRWTRRIGGGDDDRGEDAERKVQIEHPSPR